MRRSFVAALAAAVVACGGGKEVPVTGPVEPPVPGPPRGTQVAHLEIIGAPGADQRWVVGARHWIAVAARDAYGDAMDPTGVRLALSDTLVARLDAVQVVDVTRGTPVSRKELLAQITFTGPGTLTLRASAGTVNAEAFFPVDAVPPATDAAVIERFEVIEHRVGCVWDCPYVAYTPALELRVPDGHPAVRVLAVEVTMGDWRSGLCLGRVDLAGGERKHLLPWEEYLWSNQVFVVSLDGTLITDATAGVEVVLEDAAGRRGSLRATGPVRRMAEKAPLPPSAGGIEYWTC
ncbi:MAG: hypothetical protein K1X31_04535 [Gemmatimonadaceae bacterium]|nr:hypothetical protein [Gemmatimonadaceae bacterium]